MTWDRRHRGVNFPFLAHIGSGRARTASAGRARKQIGEHGVNASHGFINAAQPLVALFEAGGQADHGEALAHMIVQFGDERDSFFGAFEFLIA